MVVRSVVPEREMPQVKMFEGKTVDSRARSASVRQATRRWEVGTALDVRANYPVLS